MNFWQQLPKPFVALAPMDGVSDTVFRHVIAQAAAPDVWFSEFTNATGWVKAGERAVGTRLVKTPDEHPLVAQLWGADPDDMAQLAQHCAQLGYDGLDLNTGCPDSHAIKTGGGAALIKNPTLTSELVAALRTAGLPVSIKCRLGYSSTSEWRGWISHLLKEQPVALTVHLRTKKEMSKVDAHWELMPEIVKLRDELAPSTLIIGNGDVHDRAHAEVLAARTGIDGVMIGRGIFTNPYAFELQPRPHSRAELLSLLGAQLDWHDRIAAEYGERNFEPLKRFFKIYVRDFEGATNLRTQLMDAHSTAEVRDLLKFYTPTAANFGTIHTDAR
ncbi:MAG TPA: tRNA-dihydrouridine synthase [Candidatus Saccharimonadia bacterium]